MTSRAELEATIWRVSEPGTKRKPGQVLRARMNHAEATAAAEEMKKEGKQCVVSRV